MTTEELNGRIAQIFGMSEKVIDRMNGQVDRSMVRMYSQSLKDVKSNIAGMYEKFGDSVSLGEMSKFNRLENLEKSIQGELKLLGNESQKVMAQNIKDNFTESFYHTGYAMETPLEVSMGFGGLDKDAVRAAVINPQDRIKWPTRNKTNINMLNNRIKSAVTEGLIQGYGYAKTANLVKDKVNRSAFEALRIVRTEGQRAKATARNLAVDKIEKAGERLGIGTQQIWNATLDSSTRDEHGGIDGEAANKDGEWTFSDGTTTRGPGMSGVAEHDINCRCTTYTQVGDLGQDVRKDNESKDIIPYKKYDEWAKDKGIPTNGRAKARFTKP